MSRVICTLYIISTRWPTHLNIFPIYKSIQESNGYPLFFISSAYILASSRINTVRNLLITCLQLSIKDSIHSQNTSDMIGAFFRTNIRYLSISYISNRRNKIQVYVTGQKKYHLLLSMPQKPTSSLILPIYFCLNRKSASNL